MKLKDLFENQEYTFADWAKDNRVNLNASDFYCGRTNITSLYGAPTSIKNFFYCHRTNITSLEYAPTRVGGHFDCSNTQIDSLQGAPKWVGTREEDAGICCDHTGLKSLQNIHHHIHYIGGILAVSVCPIESNVLGVLWIGCDEQGRPRPDGKAPTAIILDNKQVQDILNKYLEKIHSKEMTPREALIHAQGELIDANLDEYADL